MQQDKTNLKLGAKKVTLPHLKGWKSKVIVSVVVGSTSRGSCLPCRHAEFLLGILHSKTYLC